MSTRALAVRLHSHDAGPVVETVPLPEPGADEVLVELAFGGVNPVDRYLAQGLLAPDGPLPRTLGSEAAGRLDGAAVLVAGQGLGAARDGVWAQRAVVPREAVVAVPDGVGLAEASAVGVAGLTAYQVVVQLAKVAAGDRVLVLGATGGVGLAVVSLAAAIGATVCGQTGSAGKQDALRDLGAADVVVADALALADAVGQLRPTVVIDALGGGFAPAALGLLQPGGRYVVFGTTAGKQVQLDLQAVYRKNLALLGYSGLGLGSAERRAGLAATLAALAGGRMRLPVASRVPLAQGASVFEALSDRALVGKVLLQMDS